MKGKFKFLYTTILCLTACLFAGVCLFAAIQRHGQVVQAVGERDENYSLVDRNTGVIMSVEKVAVASGENNDFSFKFKNQSGINSNEMKKGGLENADSSLFYEDIRSGNKTKYIVYDNDFVMLNNAYNSAGFYYNPELGQRTKTDELESGTQIYLQEAILVSVGKYFKATDSNNDEVDGRAGLTEYTNSAGQVVHEENSGANIEAMNYFIYKDGVPFKGNDDNCVIREYRNENGEAREDFMWLIAQTEGCEGFYDITVNFRYNGAFYPFHFTFYILLNTSYYGNLADGNGNNYSIQPSLSNVQTRLDGTNTYLLGKSDVKNKNYPSLTFNVDKYEVSYTHTANGVTTSYEYYNSTIDGRMYLNCNERGTNWSRTKSYFLGQKKSSNIAIIVFTEMGKYNIKFKYKYNGYNAENFPEMNLTLDDSVLEIYGFELKYAKAGTNEAQFRHITFANSNSSGTDEMSVGIVVPNGYLKGSETTDTELGVVYDYDESSARQVGSVVGLEFAEFEVGDINNEGDIQAKAESEAEKEFIKTNHGSLWLDGVNEYVNNKNNDENSVYYFGTTLTELNANIENDKRETFNNTTSFNKTGYYIVFIHVKVSDSQDYWVGYKFCYSANTVTIHTETVEDNPVEIASNSYTNKDVKIWWEEPQTFEREISVEFVRSQTNEYPEGWQQLASRPSTKIQNGAVLGTNIARVDNNTGAKFLIITKSVGKSATYRTFIIDRQNISGVDAYAVKSEVNKLENVIYTVVKDRQDINVKLTDGTTNSFATLGWDDKPSGAKITATFSKTPFVVNSSLEVGQVLDVPPSASQPLGKVWFSTKYQLGTTISGQELEKPDLNSNLDSSSVLFDQGIYYFTLRDEAGNVCTYMFVIDKTENYFKITSNENVEFQTQKNLLYNDSTKVEIGTHKVFKLDVKDSNILACINAVVANSDQQLNALNYYAGANTNKNRLKNIFAKNGNDIYLTVENKRLYVYDDMQNLKSSFNVGYNSRSVNIEAISQSNLNQIYVEGSNQILLDSPLNSNSYLIVEVNTDHSLGMAFYSNNLAGIKNFSNLTNVGENDVKRLYYSPDEQRDKLAATHAAGADYLAFSWNMGYNTKYEIGYVKYEFYDLDLTRQPKENFAEMYFYMATNRYSKTLYEKDTGSDPSVLFDDARERAVAVLNVERNQSAAGLYIVSRHYINEIEEGDKDTQDLSYYFIVDRNGIIVASGETDDPSINGGYISIGLKDNQYAQPYRSFDVSGVNTGSIILNSVSTTYNIYLTTNRLPAVLNIPVGKYFYSNYNFKQANMTNGTDYFGSEYYAGKLNFDLYFYDSFNQLGVDLNNIKLYSSLQKADNGYYVLDLAQNLSDSYRLKFINENNSSAFLTLPGDYVLVIYDNVEGVTHQKIIGIRVIGNEPPSTPIYSARKDKTDYADRIKDTVSYSLTTAEEFVVIDMENLPEKLEVGTNIYAELDLDYLNVVRTLNGVSTQYIDYDHQYNGGVDINTRDGKQVLTFESQDGVTTKRKIALDTNLRDANGNINSFDILSQPLSYTIKIRYNVAGQGDSEEYKNSYYYYQNGEKKTTYLSTYTINIDRIPPQSNIQYLQGQERLLGYYSNGEIFENAAIEEGDNAIYFVTRYKEYYAQNKAEETLYAFHVNANTPFEMEDGLSVYYRPLDTTQPINLNLPFVYTGEYNPVQAISNFGGFGFASAQYYEIVEQDAAGNATQYIIYYENGSNNDNLTLSFNASLESDGSIKEGTVEFSLEENKTITLYEIYSETALANDDVNDLFYVIELRHGTDVVSFKTNFASDLNAIAKEIANEVKVSFGNYLLRIISNYRTAEYVVNYFDKASIRPLLPEKLVKQYENGTYYIDLEGANETVDGVTYYAKEIKIYTNDKNYAETYTCTLGDDGNFVFVGPSVDAENRVSTFNGNDFNGSYRIEMTDVFGQVYNYSFNTSGEQPTEITFGENKNDNYAEYAGSYYSFKQANISFDSVVYNEYYISYELLLNGTRTTGNNVNNDNDDIFTNYISIETVANRTNVTIKPYFTAGNKSGAVLTVEVRMFNNDTGDNFVYNVVLDTSTGRVNFKENLNDSVDKEYTVDVNVLESELSSTSYPVAYSGLYYLSWVPTQNAWYDFEYAIYEEMLDGELIKTNLSNITNYPISTQDGSKGIYRFVITIKNKNGEILGNKVYTFMVQSAVTELYSVRTADGIIVNHNSSFKFDEVLNKYDSDQPLGVPRTILERMKDNDLKLYISCEELSVHPAQDIDVVVTNPWQVFNQDEYRFEIYRIYSNSPNYSENENFGIYIGILKTPKQENLIDDLSIFKGEEETKIVSPYLDRDNNKFYSLGETILLSCKQILPNDQDILPILRKNYLLASIWCNGSFVGTTSIENIQNDQLKYQIKGSGVYTFVFTDLAGNTHNFNYNNVLSASVSFVDELNIIVLQEVVLQVNSMQAIDNAYYNGQVEVKIYNPSMYDDTRQLKISCSLNGQPYDPQINQYTYTFSDYGTYRINASYIDSENDIHLSKVLIFTIVNPNEARPSFDLSSLLSYKIIKVKNNRGLETNAKGENLASKLISLLNANQSKNKYLLTYEFLQENSEALGTTSGKQKLTITYVVDNGIYPVREVEFSFTLNNQVPTIQCDVKPGDSTTDSFTITYTPAIIYDTVGDSYLYVNDILVRVIDASTANITNAESFKVSYDEFGVGDYYVSLRGSSGAVHVSFKVTIKEPLNTWSIIVIVVVVAILVGLIGTIVFLRKRMKIR